MAAKIRTDTDNSAARASVRDLWVESTRRYFIEACIAARTQPERSLERIRYVLEGFAHAVCVALDPGFPSHKGEKPNLVSLGDALEIVRRHLPPDRQDLLIVLESLGDRYHHNQGQVQRSSPNTARAALLNCAELLAWMDTEVVRNPPPLEYTEALRDLDGAAPVVTPLPSSVAVPPVVTPLPSSVASPTPPSPRIPPPPPPAPRRRARFLVPLLGGVGFVALLVIGLVTWPSPEVAWVAAYNAALASRDVDRILAVHALPTSRFFMAKNQSAAQLRALYEGWFRSSGKTRETGFRDCQLVNVAADDSRAVRCDTYVEPPLEKGPSVVAACLVFDSTGHLTSRTELSVIPGCPPPAP